MILRYCALPIRSVVAKKSQGAQRVAPFLRSQKCATNRDARKRHLADRQLLTDTGALAFNTPHSTRERHDQL